jgi:hypothetical protein
MRLSYKIISMLKFLEERETNIQPKPAYKAKPHIAFGISCEIPAIFQNQYSMISPVSARNPFVEPSHRSRYNESAQMSCDLPDWVHKTDISQIEVPLPPCRKVRLWAAETSPLALAATISPTTPNSGKIGRDSG